MADQDGIIVTPRFRMAFPNLHEPRAFMRNGKATGEPVYGLVMLFDPADVGDLKAKAKEVALAKWPGRELSEIAFPFKKGDAEAKKSKDKGKDGSFYEGKTVLKASSKYKPTVVEKDAKTEIIDASKVYSGCYAYAEVNFVAYDAIAENAKDGVKCYLNFVMKAAEGDRIAGRTAKDAFAGVVGKDTDEAFDDEDDEIPI